MQAVFKKNEIQNRYSSVRINVHIEFWKLAKVLIWRLFNYQKYNFKSGK